MSAEGGERAVVVVGGGIVGVACAHYLQQDGYSVTVVDRGTIGGGCSHGNLGYICPSHVLPLNEPGAIKEGIISLFDRRAPFRVKPQMRLGLYRWLAEFARRCTHGQMIEAGRNLQPLLAASMQEYQTLFETLGSAGQWKLSGLAYTFRSQPAMDAFAETDAMLTDNFDITATRIDGPDLPEFDNALRPDLAGAWVYEGDGFVRPSSLLQDWRSYLVEHGVEFREHCTVTDIRIVEDRIVALHTTQDELAADHYVLAMGAWSPEIGDKVRYRIPIEPGKGYSLTMSRPSVCPTHPMLFPEHRVGIAPFDDGYRIGSMMEFAGYDTSIPDRRIAQLSDSVAPYLVMPRGSETLETWYGWRPMTWDSLPIVGRVPGLNNAVLATGHNMLGVTLAAGTGRLVSEIIGERSTHINIGAFSPNRFL